MPAVLLVWEVAELAWVLGVVAWQVSAFVLVVVAQDENVRTYLFPFGTGFEIDQSSP